MHICLRVVDSDLTHGYNIYLISIQIQLYMSNSEILDVGRLPFIQSNRYIYIFLSQFLVSGMKFMERNQMERFFLFYTKSIKVKTLGVHGYQF